MLHRPWLAPLIVGFWCVTTGWLCATKIMPTFQAGAAPSGVPALAAGDRPTLVGWTVLWNDSPIGWALTTATRVDDGAIAITNRLHCDRLPLDEILPAGVLSLVRRSLPDESATHLEASGRILVDSSGRPQSFESTITLPGSQERVVLEGRATGQGMVAVTLRAGELRYETTRHVPDHVVFRDELSPQAMLPGLYEGRGWMVPVYSPLRTGNAPLQVLHALVESEETIFWANRLVNARIVTYREDPSSQRAPRCRLWVDRSGRVLRHESAVLGGRMEFVRRTDAESERLAGVAALVETDEQAAAPAATPPADAQP